jgi:hypothetical protein
MAPRSRTGHIPPMEYDATKIADLRAILAGMRRELEELELGEIDMSPPERHRLREEIANREQVLRGLGIDDA